jgi:hypothetical protein
MKSVGEALMSTDNPYAVESMSSFVGPVQGSPTEAMNRSIQALVETRPWVRLLGVFAAIGAVLGGLRCLLAAPTVFSRLVGTMYGQAERFDGFQIFTGFISLCLPVLCFFFAKYLLKFASAITRAESTRSLNDIADALVQQKKMWRLATICTVITIVVLVVIYAITRIMNGIDWLFEPLQNDLASSAMRLPLRYSSHGTE